MLKAYHLRIALSVENSETKRQETLTEIKGIWEKLTGDDARYRRFSTTVISLLLIRWGVAYWMHWDTSNVEKLKGIHGTYRGNLVVDEKLAQTGKGVGEKGKFLPDLMTPVKPGLPFFQDARILSAHRGDALQHGASEQGFRRQDGMKMSARTCATVLRHGAGPQTVFRQ